MAADLRRSWAAPAVVVALALTGCGASGGAADPAPSTSVAAPEASSAEPTPMPTTVSPTASDGSPTPTRTGLDRTATPAATSGPLTGAALPDPDALGPGWVARVDPGSAEDGYTGNGTPVLARDPQDLDDALLPFGCADASIYDVRRPLAEHALEADYAHGPTGANGIAVAMDFADATTAQRFVAAYTAARRDCTPGPGGTTVITVVDAPEGAFASVQVDSAYDTTWRQLVVRTGHVVRILMIEGKGTPARSWAAIAAGLPAL